MEFGKVRVPDELPPMSLRILYDEHRGALSYLLADEATHEAALIDHVRRAIGPVRTPKMLHPLAALPRNPVGKVVRGEVKSLIYPAPQ